MVRCSNKTPISALVPSASPRESAGQVPEALVGEAKGATAPGGDQGAGSGQGTRLDGKDLEIMVELEDFCALALGPRVGGHHRRSREGADPIGPEADVDAASGKAHRDRIEGLAHADPALGVDPAVEGEGHIKRLVGKAGQDGRSAAKCSTTVIRRDSM